MPYRCGIALAVGTAPSARITVTSATFPAAGDTLRMAVDYSPSVINVVYTPPGFGLTWDLSGLQAAETKNFVHRPAAAGLVGGQVPGADLVMTSPPGTAEYYYNVTGTAFELQAHHGIAPYEVTTSQVFAYGPPLRERAAPLDFFDIRVTSSGILKGLVPSNFPPALVAGLGVDTTDTFDFYNDAQKMPIASVQLNAAQNAAVKTLFKYSPPWVADAGSAPSARVHLRQNQPNPFNPRTTIGYDLPEAGAVRLAVFDLAGRLVRTLVDEDRPQGAFEAVWDGRDASGREGGSGSYVARLEFGGKVEVVRMGLVRQAGRTARPSPPGKQLQSADYPKYIPEHFSFRSLVAILTLNYLMYCIPPLDCVEFVT